MLTMNNVLVVEAPLFFADKEGGSVYHAIDDYYSL
jgi:hypothetical protein